MITLLLTRILYQRLGEAQFGLVNLALSVVLLCSIGVSYGYHLNGPKRMALFREDTAKKQALINEIIITRVLIAIGIAMGLFCLTYFLGFFKSYTLFLYYALIVLFSEALFPMFYYQGSDKISWLSLANICAKGTYLLSILFFVKLPKDAPIVNALFGLTALMVNIVFWIIIYKKEKIAWVWVGFHKIKARLIENFQFFIASIAGQVSIYGGLVILASFVNNIELGKYALAQKVALMLRMIPAFFTQAILQKAAILFEKDKPQFKNYLRRIFLMGLSITFVIGMMVLISAKFIVFLLAGNDVAYSVNVLKILAFIPFLSMLNFSNMIKILVDEKKHLLTKATWITAISMLVLASLGSYYYGGYGMSWALVFTEIVSFIVYSLILRKDRHETS